MIIASLTILLMSVVSLPFVLATNDEYPVVGADVKEISLNDHEDMDDLANTINNALEDHDEVTVTGSRTGGGPDGRIDLYIPAGRTVLWEAGYDYSYGIVLHGKNVYDEGYDLSGSFIVIGNYEEFALPYLYVCDGVEAEIDRNVIFNYLDSGVKDDAVLTVNGNLTLNGAGCGAVASDRGVLTVNGDITSNAENCYIKACDDSVIYVEGSVTFSADISYIFLADSGRIAITGSVTADANGEDILLIQVEGQGGELTAGCVTTSGRGIWVVDGGKVTINGDLSAKGAFAIESSGEVTINGNVVAENAGVQSGGGSVVIEGTLTADADHYIGFLRGGTYSDFLHKDDCARTGDYYVYDGSGLIGTDAFVYVKAYGGTDGTRIIRTPDGGWNTSLILVIVSIAAAAAAGAVYYYFAKRRQ